LIIPHQNDAVSGGVHIESAGGDSANESVIAIILTPFFRTSDDQAIPPGEGRRWRV
jgi:hypothetical protein